jgi:PAS domain S-box-containing protein
VLLERAGTSRGPGVTESPRAPLDLQEQAELVELANDAIFVRAVADATILAWNRGAEVLYGWARHEAIGRVSHELLRTEFPRPVEEIEAELWQSGR